MKHIFRAILVYSVAIALTGLFLPGIDYGNRIGTLLLAAIVMGITNTFIRPVLNLILLPVNIITLGLVGLLMNAIILFIVTLLVQDFNVIPFTIQFGTSSIFLPLIWSYIVSATILSTVIGVIRKIVNP
jgi:putative membrane protein